MHTAGEKQVVVEGLDGYIIAERNGALLVCSLKEEQNIKRFYSKTLVIMKRNSTMSLFAAMLLLTGSGCILMTGCQKDYDGQIEILRNQIENGDVNVVPLLEKIELIEKQIVTLQEAAKEHAEFKESISKLIKDLETTQK